MSFGAKDLLDRIPVLVSVIAILVAGRAEQKSQPITSFARQKRKEFRGEFEPQLTRR
jgi:hypothetical protein